MAKSSGSSPTAGKGKGKVTPVQIAFLVDRYLSDNNYTNSLSSFRSEASQLFSKTKVKEVPKGLLSLGDILDEYIVLKEQKVILDQEKRRVDMLLHGIQDAARVYHSTTSTSPLPPALSHPPTLLSPAMLSPTVPFVIPSNPSGSSPAVGHMIQNIHVAKANNAMEPINFSTPKTILSSRNKRRNSKPVPRATPAPKKPCAEASDASVIGDVRLQTQVNATSNAEEVTDKSSRQHLVSSDQPKAKSPVRGSSVAKSLFKQLPESQARLSSPKTPPQPSPSQSDKSESPEESSCHSQCTGVGNTPQEMTPSKCSVISSKKIIVISPFKQSGYYSVERSHHVSASPVKSSPSKLGKRDHVKGRLDFDDSERPLNSGETAETQTFTSNDEPMPDDFFVMDLPDLDGDFSFSQLLIDFDLDSEGVTLPSQPSLSCSTDFITWSEHETGSGSVETKTGSSELQSITGFLSEKEMNFQGPDSMSVRTVTKCIKIVSPAKSNRNSSLEQADSQART